MSERPIGLDALLERASEVRERAYAPYSGFPVGAAIRTASGEVFVGANVENAAFPEGLCAEASAIGAMVSAGERSIEVVVTMCGGDLLATPCGGCRQKIREFATWETRIYAASPNGVEASYSMVEVLPDSFGPEHLEHRSKPESM